VSQVFIGVALMVGRLTPMDIVKGRPETIIVESPAFQNGSRIPDKYTCSGADVSPPLKISGIPEDSKSLLLVMYDPDAPIGIFYHWTMYNIPVSISVLPEGVTKEPRTDYGVQGRYDLGLLGYNGPCPPVGHGVHRYYFMIAALDTLLDLRAGAGIRDVLRSARNHVIAYGVYMGTYSR